MILVKCKESRYGDTIIINIDNIPYFYQLSDGRYIFNSGTPEVITLDEESSLRLSAILEQYMKYPLKK